MPHRYEAASSPSGPDREISLGTGTILAIFFLLALVCSVFFGFGYTMGHKSNPLSTAAASEAPSRSLSDAFKTFKPAPGNPAAATSTPPANSLDDTGAPTPAGASVVVPAATAKSSTPAAAAAVKKPFDPDAEIVTSVNPPAKPSVATHPTPAPRTEPTEVAAGPAPAGTAMVQVAAVSHQEDADTLIAALKRKGYSVAVHHEPQDKLLHIQLGPYPSRKDAEAMRQRLQSDNYNAIVK